VYAVVVQAELAEPEDHRPLERVRYKQAQQAHHDDQDHQTLLSRACFGVCVQGFEVPGQVALCEEVRADEAKTADHPEVQCAQRCAAKLPERIDNRACFAAPLVSQPCRDESIGPLSNPSAEAGPVETSVESRLLVLDNRLHGGVAATAVTSLRCADSQPGAARGSPAIHRLFGDLPLIASSSLAASQPFRCSW
jgi:hypothetical protein